jgi:hypothetical protein
VNKYIIWYVKYYMIQYIVSASMQEIFLQVAQIINMNCRGHIMYVHDCSIMSVDDKLKSGETEL